jgi:Rps23 Pro-64 3,4-dihydroxylase Tpa1-like proline 4-hydroxylase
MNIIQSHNWQALSAQFLNSQPFNHVVIDNFFTNETADQLIAEFPDYHSGVWDVYYNNALENKKTCNQWNLFPSVTYRTFNYLCSSEFTNNLKVLVDNDNLMPDLGLHGGGWHAHTAGGKLNIHLDYSIHPKLKLQRHYNIIVYLTPEWDLAWGGGLELWGHDAEINQPLKLERTIENRFNRAVIFDTSQNSWHGLPKNLTCPNGQVRRSLAIYYVSDPDQCASPRPRVLFAPYGDQYKDAAVLDLIKRRASI